MTPPTHGISVRYGADGRRGITPFVRHPVFAIPFWLSLLPTVLGSLLWIQSYALPLRLRNNGRGCIFESMHGGFEKVSWSYPPGWPPGAAIALMKKWGQDTSGWDEWRLTRVAGANFVPVKTWSTATSDYWTFTLPSAAVAVATGVAGRRTRRRRPGECAGCGYDLRATPDCCRECGAAVDK